MFHECQQRLAESEIKNHSMELKGFRVISEQPQASTVKQLPTYEIIQLMMFLDDGERWFWLQTPWRFSVELAQRFINILHVNVRDVGPRPLKLDSENRKIMSPLR